jgi:hypothetical protein
MTKEELNQFIQAVVQASAFSPRVTSTMEDAWMETIGKHGGKELLQLAIKEHQERPPMAA